MMKPIVQKDACGCGLACVAFVASQKYHVIRGHVDAEQAMYKGFSMKELRAILLTYDIDSVQNYVKSRRHKVYRENTIVFIGSSPTHPNGHYLVRHDGRWMDPWINCLKDGRINYAKAGYRKRLPGQPVWAIFMKPI